MPLRLQLQTTKKGSLSVSDYFAKMENLADSLFLAGAEISDGDLITNILMGLPTEYDVLVAMVSNKMQSSELPGLDVTVQEVLAMALSQETRIEHMLSSINTDVHGAMVNYVDSRSRGRSRGGRSGRGRFHGSRAFSAVSSRPICQICNRAGHVASACWHRLDENYHPPSPTRQAPVYTQPSGSYNDNNNNLSQSRSAHSTPGHATFFTGPETVYDPAWYADSGATAHVTNSMENLQVSSGYKGKEKLMVGNEQEVGETFASRHC